MSVIVVQCIAKLELGGAQKIVLDLMRELKNQGILITGEGGKLYSAVKEEFGERHVTLSCLKRKISPLQDIICYFKLRKILIKLHNRYDRIILHTHGSKAGVLGRIVSGSLPFVHSVHVIHGFAVNPYISHLKRFIYLTAERISSCFGDVIVTVARVHIKRAIEWGMSKKVKYFCIPNYVNADNFRVRRKKNKSIKIVTVSNFKPQKNPFMWAKTALEVTSRFGNVEFIYIGDGPLRENVERFLQASKGIKILGWRNDIDDLLPCMDIFFLPSRWEGLPLSVLEAMASALPVVASAVDGTTEVVLDNVTGYLLSPDDLDGYLHKLGELIENAKKRKEMGREGRERVKKCFSYKNMIEKVFYIYVSLGFTYSGKNR
ncbi:glycosyltransferase family 4 protein [candidate division WOR-3 bacterium]|nr:glycosyltransferase family 4 protein [candidate division WOR-3 bacterium]